MNLSIKSLYIIFGLSLFIVLPILFFILGNFPERTILKESISIITILAFFIVLGQFYLSRLNESMLKFFKVFKVIKVHKIIAYIVLPVLLVHPFLIVVPRFFEVGANPIDSFILMITSFDNLGVVLGLITWILMLALGFTSMFQKKLKMKYKTWKLLHGTLALLFIILASWHSIDIGRHMSTAMIVLIVFLCFISSFYLIKNNFFNENSKEILI